MSRIDLDVTRYCRLARLALPAARAASVHDELGRILERFSTMRRGETPDGGAAGSERDRAPRSLDTAREDVVVASRIRDAIVDPTRTDASGAFRVPRVIE